MLRSILAGTATIAVAALLPQVPAIAQEGATSAITVSAPASRVVGEPVDGVQQRTQLIANVTVEIHDLDLRTDQGRAVLDARIERAAEVACERLDQIDPPVGVGGGTRDDDCRHLAVRSAELQRDAAIRAAG
jgi:UrcA family protein